MNANLVARPCVYALRSGGVPFYVGKTTVNARTRLWEHRSRARAGHPAPVYESMRAAGVDTIEIVELDDDPAREGHWIEELRRQGHVLANDVGASGAMSERTKALLSEKAQGRTPWIAGRRGEEAGWTAERRAAQSARMRARAA